MYNTHRISEQGKTHRTVSRNLFAGTVTAACGRTVQESSAWAAGAEVTCSSCLKRETCDRGHMGCGTPELCAQIAQRTPTLSLVELERAADAAGLFGKILNTGGNVLAVAITVDGREALVAVDYGQTEGSTWAVALDGETREAFGELEADELPVTSDADQTIADAAAWVRHVTSGAPLADGDVTAVWPSHGARVSHHGPAADPGTAVGEQYTDADGEPMIGVIWDDSPAFVEATYLDRLTRPRAPKL